MTYNIPFNNQPFKHLGQNYLMDKRKLQYIAQLCGSGKQLIEIGAGTGQLTQYLLLQPFTEHIFIEIDVRHKPILEQMCATQGNVIYIDILKMYLGDFLESNTIVSNMPYNIAPLILKKLMFENSNMQRGIFLLQRELVSRICASENTSAYGVLSILMQYVFDIRKSIQVPPHCFYPIPQVQSQVIICERKPHVDIAILNTLDHMIKPLFQKRRKMLRNYAPLIFKNLLQLGYSDTVRAENVTVTDYFRLAGLLQN